MSIRLHRLIALVLPLLLLLTPQVANALFGSITVGDEKELGRKFDETIRTQLQFVDDPEVTNYVKGVVDRVAATLPPQPWKIKSAVVANGSMNAFAVPGGYIYIFTGLILGVENEDELAAVIGHELGHVTQRHVAQRMEKMKYISIASIAGTVAGALLGAGGGSNTSNIGRAVMTGSMAGAQSAFLMYTRQNENEADNVGLDYMTKAGYNPKAMPQTFVLMQKKTWFLSGDTIPSYLATHPGLEERIEYLRDRIKRMPAELVAREFNKVQFQRIQTILRARMTSAETALAYYDSKPKAELTCLDLTGRGIALDRLRRVQQADQAFSAALACGPEDPLVLREAGIFHFNHGAFNKAGPYLQKAAVINPKDAVALFYLARLMGERKDYAGAISTMENVIRDVPEDAEVRFYYGRILGESGDLFGANLQMAYSYHYGRDSNKAEMFLGRAKALAHTEDQKRKLGAYEKATGKGGKGGKPGEGEGRGGPGDGQKPGS
jgi:predicted Zn-dependent protease